MRIFNAQLLSRWCAQVLRQNIKLLQRKDTKIKDQIIRENNTKISSLERNNKIQLDHVEELKRINEKTKTKKRDLVEKKKKMVEQIEELKADKEELKLKLQLQTDPEELD